MTRIKKARPADPLTGATPETTYGVAEAAERLGTSYRTVLDAIHDGSLPAYLPAGRTDGRRAGRMGWRIKPEDLRDWFLGGKTNARD